MRLPFPTGMHDVRQVIDLRERQAADLRANAEAGDPTAPAALANVLADLMELQALAAIAAPSTAAADAPAPIPEADQLRSEVQRLTAALEVERECRVAAEERVSKAMAELDKVAAKGKAKPKPAVAKKPRKG